MPAATTNPALISSSPAVTTTLVPARFMATMASGENAPVTTANGTVARPARSGS